MIVAVRKAEADEEDLGPPSPPGERKPLAASVRKAHAQPNVEPLRLSPEAQLRRYYRTSLAAEAAAYDDVIEAASGAEVEDDASKLARWLEHWNPPGYTTNIRTNPKGKATSNDFVVIGGEPFEAYQRMKRVQVVVKDESAPFGVRRVYRNEPDVCSKEEVQVEGILTYRNGQVRTVQRTVTRYRGLIPLGKPDDVLCTFVPLRFDKRAHYEADKKVYLDRKAYSDSVRRAMGKESYPPRSRWVLRRPPDVMWFLQNPSGKSEFFEDDFPWEHGIVDPQAEASNDAMRREAVDILNSWKVEGIQPMCTIQYEEGRPRKYSHARALSDPYYVEAKAGRTVPQYEGTESTNLMKEALARYAQVLKDVGQELGYPSEGENSLAITEAPNMGNVVYMDGVDAWAPKEEPEDDGLEGLVNYTPPERVPLSVPQIGTRTQYVRFLERDDAVDDAIEGEVVSREEEEIVRVDPRVGSIMGMTRENLERLINKTMKRDDIATIHFEGGRRQFRLYDERDLQSALQLLGEMDEKRDALVNLIFHMKVLQGWPAFVDEYADEVNMDGLLDDADVEMSVERVPRLAKLQDFIPRRRGRPSPAFTKLIRTCERVDRAQRKRRERAMLRAVPELVPGSRRYLIAVKSEEVKRRYNVRQEVARLRLVAMNARAYRDQLRAREQEARMNARAYQHQLKAREQDARDYRIMHEMAREAGTVKSHAKRLRMRIAAKVERLRRRWKGESAPLITPEQMQTVADNHVKSLLGGNSTKRTVRRSASKPAEPAKFDLIIPVAYEPAKEIELVGKQLMAKGIPREELLVADMHLAPYMRRAWPRLSDHRSFREQLMEGKLVA